MRGRERTRRWRADLGAGAGHDLILLSGSTGAVRLALRIIEELATLADRMARDHAAHAGHRSAHRLEERSPEFRRHAGTIRQVPLTAMD